MKKLQEAYDICDVEDRSIEYTIEYMQDYADVDFDVVIKWLEKGEGL
jgi:hypothetical protein